MMLDSNAQTLGYSPDGDGDVEVSGLHPDTASLGEYAMTLREFDKILIEVRQQPDWRMMADREAAYYDGNQLSSQVLAELDERGQAPIITNLIRPTIDAVLGIEAKARTDWIVRDEYGDSATEDTATALSVLLKRAETQTRADKAISDAYAKAIKVGIGWVEITRETDPFIGDYRVQEVDRNEIWWDWRSRRADTLDMRYLVRRRWTGIEEIKAIVPDAVKAALYSVGAYSGDHMAHLTSQTDYARALDAVHGTSLNEYEWITDDRSRACLYEVWYRRTVTGMVIKSPIGRYVELDLDDEQHCEWVMSGRCKPRKTAFTRVFQAIFLGPHLILNRVSPYRHRFFPYVPMYGFREDQSGIPYGLIRSMMSPQDEINARKRKMMWLLSSRRVITDDDAVVDHDLAAQEVSRPDCYIQLNSKRRPGSQFAVEDSAQLSAQQFQVLIDAKGEINQAAGVYPSMMGQDSSATSGLAINSLIEQGNTTLGEVNDNASTARRIVGEMLLSLILEDLSGQATPVIVGSGKSQRTIVLNGKAVNADGTVTDDNNTDSVNVSVQLDDAIHSPTAKMQHLAQLTEIIKSIPDEAKVMLLDLWVDAADVANKEVVMDRLRKALGISDDMLGDNVDPEKEALRQKVQELTSMIDEIMASPQMEESKARIGKIAAETDKIAAETEEIIKRTEEAEEDGDEDDPIESEENELGE